MIVISFIKTIEAEIIALGEESKSLEKAGEEKIKLETENKSLSENASKLNVLKDSLASLEKAKAAYTRSIEIYKEKQAIAEKIDSEYKQDPSERYDIMDYVDEVGTSTKNNSSIDKNTTQDALVLLIIIAVGSAVVLGIIVARRNTN